MVLDAASLQAMFLDAGSVTPIQSPSPPPEERKDGRRGYVYVLVNASMPGLVKIGRTVRSPGERIAELSTATGVPTPFALVHEESFADCQRAEQEVHSRLSDRRVNSNREFFNVSVKDAIALISELKSHEVKQKPVTHTEISALSQAIEEFPKSGRLTDKEKHVCQSPPPPSYAWDTVRHIPFQEAIDHLWRGIEKAEKAEALLSTALLMCESKLGNADIALKALHKFLRCGNTRYRLKISQDELWEWLRIARRAAASKHSRTLKKEVKRELEKLAEVVESSRLRDKVLQNLDF